MPKMSPEEREAIQRELDVLKLVMKSHTTDSLQTEDRTARWYELLARLNALLSKVADDENC